MTAAMETYTGRTKGDVEELPAFFEVLKPASKSTDGRLSGRRHFSHFGARRNQPSTPSLPPALYSQQRARAYLQHCQRQRIISLDTFNNSSPSKGRSSSRKYGLYTHISSPSCLKSRAPSARAWSAPMYNRSPNSSKADVQTAKPSSR